MTYAVRISLWSTVLFTPSCIPLQSASLKVRTGRQPVSKMKMTTAQALKELAVNKDATEAEIRHAFKKLALKWYISHAACQSKLLRHLRGLWGDDC